MIKLRKQPVLVKGGKMRCVPNSVASLFEADPEVLAKAFKTKSNGTNFVDAISTLSTMTDRRISLAFPDCDWIDAWWIEALSHTYPLLLSCEWHQKVYRMGRCRKLHHAIAVVDGVVYDPASPNDEIPVSLLLDERLDRNLYIGSMAIIER